MPYQTKTFCDYNLMKHYVQVVESYFTDAKTILGEKMLMYMLTSSCSLDACIDGWSDIDILVVVDKLDFAELDAMYSAQKKYDISIALRLLSRHELTTGMFDDIIKVVFYQISIGMSAPNFIVSDMSFIIPNVNLKQIQEDDKLMLPWQLERLRRMLCEPLNNKRMMIKHLYTVIKMLLRSPGHEIVTVSYVEAFKKFAEEFNEERFDIMTEIASKQPVSERFIMFAQRVTERVCNGQY